MTKAPSPNEVVHGLLMVAFVCLAAGCGSEEARVTSKTSQYEVADSASESSGQPAATSPQSSQPRASLEQEAGIPEKPSAQPPAEVRTGATSGSPADKMIAFIGELQRREPQGTSREELVADFQQTQQQIISTAEQLYENETKPETRMAAAGAKLQALSSLEQVGVEGAGLRLIAYCDELAKSDIAELVQVGRQVGFANRVNAFAAGDLNDPDELAEHFRKLVAAEAKDESLLTIGRQVASIFEQTGHIEHARKTLNELAASLSGGSDPEMKANVERLAEEADIVASEVRNKFVAMMQDESDDGEQFLAAANELLASDRRGAATVTFLLRQAAFTLENASPAVADRLYAAIGESFNDHSNEEIVSMVRESIDRYEKRSGLIGQPFSVEGIDRDGAPLDWSKFAGKVVLVDFWATWCGPCLREFPNIRQNYEKYQEQGFEVVGVNLDDDPNALKEFFSLQELPWTTVISSDPETRGMETPLAVDCGVEFIPFIVLVGRDGKVAALNVRGPMLGPKVAELLALAPNGEADASASE